MIFVIFFPFQVLYIYFIKQHSMKKIGKICLIVASMLLVSCGGNDTKKTPQPSKAKTTKTVKTPKKVKKTQTPASQLVDLTNKGVGPIKNLKLEATVDHSLSKKGEEIFTAKCKACHKIDKKFIGPAVTGVTKRRSPEWIMNMILNPNNMVLKDPLAKQLLMEFNGAPMANQNLSKEDARAVLEYFRTL